MELSQGLKLRIFHYGEKKDRQFALFICIYLILNAVNSMLQTTFGITGSSLQSVRVVMYAVIFLALAAGFLTLTRDEKSKFIALEIGIGLTYLFSMLYGGGTSTTEWLIESLGIYMPLGFYAYAVEDKQNLYRELLRSSWLLFVVMVIYSLRITTYSMHFGYSILLLILLHLNEATNGKKWYWLLAVVETVLLLRLGSRGAVISIGVFLALKVIANSTSRYKFFYAGLLLAVLAGLLYTINNYGLVFYQYLASQGRASRTMYLLLTGQMTSHDSGRMDLWRMSIEAIKRKPWFGWGIGGVTSELQGHPYPHQMFLDLMCSFGVPIGAALSILVVVKAIKALMRPVSVQKELMSIFFCIGFVSLMFSGTCFTNYYFFLFLGLTMYKRSNDSVDIKIL